MEPGKMMKKKGNPFEEPIELEVGQNGNPEKENADNAAPAAESGDDELEELKQALATAEQEKVLHRDAMLRMQAEMENLRKRLIRDLEKSRRFALERIMKDLLQVRDSMERGLEADVDSSTTASLLEGQALTLKMFAKVMQDHDLELIDPMGEPFNPEFHEAMAVQPSEELEENSVMEVLQKGYKLHDRLVRPAMVLVSRKP
jgi:molecular chaperone GrpE